MPVRLEVEHPEDNVLRVSPKFLEEGTGRIRVTGKGNLLHVETPLEAGNGHFELTGDAQIIVRQDCSLGDLHVYALAPGAFVEIGSWTSFNGVTQIIVNETARVTVGSGSLFGNDCLLQASDVHPILDLKTGQRLNPPGDIEIGEHVWLAPQVTILKNSSIGRDSVIGHSSVVNGRFPQNSLLAGVPARVAREGITWAF